MCAENIGDIETSMTFGENIVALAYSMKFESNLTFTMKIMIFYDRILSQSSCQNLFCSYNCTISSKI